MNKNLNIIKDLSTIILQSILYYTFFIGLSYLSSDKNTINYILPLIILPYVIISYLARKLSKNIVILMLVNILMFVSSILICNNINQRIILTLIVIAMIFLSTEYWSKRGKKPLISTPHIAFEIVFIIILLISDSSFKVFINVISLLGIGYLIFSLLTLYVTNLKSYIKYNNHIEALPISNIINVTNSSLTFLFFGSFIFIFLIKILNIDKLLTYLAGPIITIIKNTFIEIIRFIFPLFNLAPPFETGSKIKYESLEMVEDTSLNDPDTLADILVHYLCIFLIIAVVLFIAYLIYKFFKTNFNKFELATDEVETIHKTNKANKMSTLIKKSKNYENSNNSKIRKAYFKKVSKIKSKIPSINNLLTHIEISKEVKKNSDNDINELTNLYEKARYSNISCNKEDVHKAKNL